MGKTDENGHFNLKHPRGPEGAPAGEYAVVISRLIGQDGKPVELAPGVFPADLGAVESLPPRYSDYNATQLTATVPSPDGEYMFDLKGK